MNCLHCGLQMPEDYVRCPRCHMPTAPNMPLADALRDRDIADMAHIARTRYGLQILGGVVAGLILLRLLWPMLSFLAGIR